MMMSTEMATRASSVRSAVLHVVAADEAGPCTLRFLAHAARAGDAVLVLGPGHWIQLLREQGLTCEVTCVHVASIGGSWWLALTLASSRAASLWRESTRVVAYGARAECLMQGAGCAHVERASLAASLLPTTELCKPEHRERVRKELGIRADECAMLVAGEPVARIDLRFIVRATAMANVGGARVRVIASPLIPSVGEISSRFVKATNSPAIVLDARAAEPWKLFGALDAVIVDRDGGLDSPVECAGNQRVHALDARYRLDQAGPSTFAVSAAMAVKSGLTVFAHDSLDVGECADSSRVLRFDSDIAVLARAVMDFASARRAQPSNATAASR